MSSARPSVQQSVLEERRAGLRKRISSAAPGSGRDTADGEHRRRAARRPASPPALMRSAGAARPRPRPLIDVEPGRRSWGTSKNGECHLCSNNDSSHLVPRFPCCNPAAAFPVGASRYPFWCPRCAPLSQGPHRASLSQSPALRLSLRARVSLSEPALRASESQICRRRTSLSSSPACTSAVAAPVSYACGLQTPDASIIISCLYPVSSWSGRKARCENCHTRAFTDHTRAFHRPSD